jgi:hypothetical protein
MHTRTERDFSHRDHLHIMLQVRNKCVALLLSGSSTALYLLAVTLPLGSLSAAETEIKHTNAACGIEFRLPRNWSVVSLDDEDSLNKPRCLLTLQPNNLIKLVEGNDGIDLYTVSISVFDEDFDVQLSRGGNFESNDGKWSVVGRMDTVSPAYAVKGSGWWGVQGTAAVGCYSERGYKGMCDSPRAFIGNHSKRSAYIQAGPQSEAILASVLKTFRFRQR